MATTQASAVAPTVYLVDAKGEWLVRVVDKTGVTITRSFEHKEYAEAFAQGQRIRLGLDGIERLRSA